MNRYIKLLSYVLGVIGQADPTVTPAYTPDGNGTLVQVRSVILLFAEEDRYALQFFADGGLYPDVPDHPTRMMAKRIIEIMDASKDRDLILKKEGGDQ